MAGIVALDKLREDDSKAPKASGRAAHIPQPQLQTAKKQKEMTIEEHMQWMDRQRQPIRDALR